MKVERWALGVFLILFFLASVVWRPASALDPATLSLISLREESVANASESYFYSQQPLLLTNCIDYAGTTTNSARQNLSNLTVIVKLGSSSTNCNIYTGTVASATGGTWWARIDSLPTNWDAPYIFHKLTNASDVFGYPFKILKVKSPL